MVAPTQLMTGATVRTLMKEMMMETTSMKTMKMVMVKMVMIPTPKEMVMAILTKKGRLMRKPSKAIVDDSCIVDSDLQEAN